MPDPTLRTDVPQAVRAIAASAALIAAAVGAVLPPTARAADVDHLVVSELATGGASASDEFIELLNPSSSPLPLAGLELVYVTGSGATVTQRAAWGADAPALQPGAHVLVANEAGIHGAGADHRYASGIAASGGTVVLRVAATAVAIDAVGWGTAGGPWVEGVPAPAPAAGASIERISLDGHVLDTHDNAADFVERATPTPTALGASPATPTPSPAATAATTPVTSAAPTATPRAAVTIAVAREAPNGAKVTVEGTALTGSGFHDGGGYVTDATGGIAVLVDGGEFASGARVVVTGTIEDRFAQRTIRADAGDLLAVDGGAPVMPAHAATGAVSERFEGRLVRVSGTVRGTPTALASGLAFDLDDGTGAARVLVATATGIDTAAWTSGTTLEVDGVVGQRDSSGTGTSGYRILPRSPSDVSVTASSAPTPTATPDASAQPTAGAALATPISIAAARAAAVGTDVTVRGTVTMPAGIVDATTAVIQDPTAAIVVRVDDGWPVLRIGDLIEVSGVRSTRSGMETLRAAGVPSVLGVGPAPSPLRATPSSAWEGLEARLVVVSGTLDASARRASSGTVSFDLADRGATVRVVLPAALGADDATLVANAAVEVVAIVGQETTGAEPAAGYRLWARSASAVRVLRSPAASAEGTDDAEWRPRPASGSGRVETPAGSLGEVGTVGLADIRVGATLVAGDWPELGIAGVLWDGERLVAISAESRGALASLAPRRLPIAIAASGLRVVGSEPRSGSPVVALGAAPGDVVPASSPATPPTASFPEPGEPARWVTLVGRLERGSAGARLVLPDGSVSLEIACEDATTPNGTVSATGIGVAVPATLIVPCEGVRAAPNLVRGAVTSAPDDAMPSRGAAKERAPRTAAVEPRRLLAGSMLALGAAVAAAAALARRRPHARDEPGAGAGADEQGGRQEPHLTLVPLRREGGP